MSGSHTYKDAGVDIDSGNALIEKIKPLAKETRRSEVISGIGGFSGLFALDQSKVENPVLVAATDGVGTKLKVAMDMQDYNHLGQDLVAMCVNDLICCGAEPLFFLDYFATGKLNVDQASAVINSVSKSLKSINCTLLGGETAEMPGLYKGDDFDVAGFSVGVVDRTKIVDGSNVKIGSKIIGIASSGIHSNGYSLVRKIIESKNLDLNKNYGFSDKTLGQELLIPTQLYVNPVLAILKNHQVSSMAHITGGGLVENLPRVLPQTCKAVLDASAIQIPPLFLFFEEQGQVPREEMWRVFNMGIGYTLIIAPEDQEAVIQQLNAMDYPAHCIGEIAAKADGDTGVEWKKS